MKSASLVMAALAALLALAACSEHRPTATFLSFTESGPDGDAYPVRMLVSGKFLRIEDGDGQDGYVLFDRAARVVYSVNRADKTTLVVRARPVKLSPPAKFEQAVERDPKEFPAVDGKPVVHYRLLTNRERCFDVYAAEGLLPEAVTALREYQQALAGEQAVIQGRTPASMQSVCDLADLIFLPGRNLDQGFPVRQVNHAGVTRQLVDFKRDIPAKAGMFELPGDYKRITTSDVKD
jgi:hypothetical protein